MPITVSVIATVLNEAASLDGLLSSLAAQTRAPDEVIIVDGGSSDGTWERLGNAPEHASLPLAAVQQPGTNIAQGRNAATALARGPIIAVADAGVRLEPDWLERLVAPFEGESPPDVVSGFFVPDPHSPFELALGAITLPRLEDVDTATFNPSSRSLAFRRAAWEALGGYPEWLDYCEDLFLDFALRDAGYRFVFEPRALVHFRPRRNLRAFFRQYYRYARGDGKADFWRYRHLLRYATYGVGLVIVGLAAAVSPLWWLAALAGMAALLRAPLRRLLPALKGRPWREQLAALAWAPLIRVTGDAAKMLGYPVGVVWRWRHAPQGPWPKRQW